MPTREEDILSQIQAKAKEHFHSINIKITAQQEATLRKFLSAATTPEMQGKFDEHFPIAMDEFRKALEGYRVNVYFADFSCLGFTQKAYQREVKKLANAFGRLASLMETITYFQVDALSNYHKELFPANGRNKYTLEARLRIIESHLNSRIELHPIFMTIKSDCLDHLLQKVGEIYNKITGKNYGYSQEKEDKDTEKEVRTRDRAFTGHFVNVAALIFDVIGESRSNIGLGNKVKRARKKCAPTD